MSNTIHTLTLDDNANGKVTRYFVRNEKSNIKNQTCGVPARRDDFLNFAFCILIFALSAASAYGHDWPMWRFDAGRCASSPEELPAGMNLLWVRELAPPRPAWPASQDRLQFDASYEPVVAGKTIFVGSMVSDNVTAYDTETGAEKWRFYTDGPVRFAPVAYKDKLYVACDDGYLYCLSAHDGALIRKFPGGPAPNKVIGNDRVISMWPARGGPVLYDGTIYFAAGIWPFMGTFIHAIDAESGKVVWTNSGSGSTYLMQPHSSPAFAGVAPQGYLVATKDKLLISGGRSVPAAYDRLTGQFLYYRLKDYGKTGTCEVMASDDHFFNSEAIYGLSDGTEISKSPASVITDDVVIGKKGNGIAAYRLEPDAKKAEGLWQAKIPSDLGNIHLKAGSRLYCSGNGGAVLALDLPASDAQPEVSWRAKVDGRVWSMLAADGKLFVVTLEGGLYCFAGEAAEPKRYARRAETLPAGSARWSDQAKQILETTGRKEGYCLLLGLGTGELLYRLLDQSQLHVVALDPDAGKVEAIRRKLDDAGHYGTRAAVNVGDITTMQLAPYMADLIVSEDLDAAGLRQGSRFLERVFHSLRPYGGTACFAAPQAEQAAILKQAAELELPGCKTSSSGGFAILTRAGALPDSADWTHQYADSANTVMSRDKRVKAPLGLLWFGGPSNDKVLPRHGHGPSPQVVDGRLFIEGRNMLRAVDVYTGRLLWEREFRDLGEYYDNTSHQPGANEIGSNYVSLSDAVYVVYGDTIHVLDPATGKTTKEFSMPGEDKPNWGTLLVWEDLLIGTASPIHVPLKAKKEQQASSASEDNVPAMTIDADYGSCSKMLVAMDRRTGSILWKRTAANSFRHNAIVAVAGKVFCIDGMSDAKLAYLKRRGLNAEQNRTLYALDASRGEPLWSVNNGIFGTWLSYSAEHDVLLEAGSQSGDRALDEADRGMTAYRGTDGKVLWSNDDRYKGPPILYHNWVITQTGGGSGSAAAEAKAFDLLTGKSIMRNHPMTGETLAWEWVRFKGCNTAVASENLLTFRSASGAFVDLTAGGGTASLGGFKSGCTSNLIIANGVLNAPDYTRTCVCSYQNQASLALVHMPEVAYWTFDYYTLPEEPTPVKQVGINFGAPGNRYAENGTLWLEFPSVGGPSPDVPVRAEYQDPKWFRHHSSAVQGPYNWITASGVTGLREVRVRMFIQPGKNPSLVDAFDKHIGQIPTWPEAQIKGSFEQARPFTVRLYFAETEPCETGRRVFDVSLQGRRVLENFDIAKEAGGINRTVVREFKGIEVQDDLKIALARAAASEAEPLLCGIEIIAEGW
jgi:outer membrane protein assembly factor BamB